MFFLPRISPYHPFLICRVCGDTLYFMPDVGIEPFREETTINWVGWHPDTQRTLERGSNGSNLVTSHYVSGHGHEVCKGQMHKHCEAIFVKAWCGWPLSQLQSCTMVRGHPYWSRGQAGSYETIAPAVLSCSLTLL